MYNVFNESQKRVLGGRIGTNVTLLALEADK